MYFISKKSKTFRWLVDCIEDLRRFIDISPYSDFEAGDNQPLKIQVARPEIEPRSSCSASQVLDHSATNAPLKPSVSNKMHFTADINSLV